MEDTLDYDSVLGDPEVKQQVQKVLATNDPKPHPMADFGLSLFNGVQGALQSAQQPAYGPGNAFGPQGGLKQFIENIPIVGGLTEMGRGMVEQGPLSSYLLGNDPRFAGLTPGTPEFDAAKRDREYNLAAGVAGQGPQNVGGKSAVQPVANVVRTVVDDYAEFLRTGALPEVVNPAAVARETAPFTPGFARSAEQRIAGAGVTKEGISSELGVNLDKIDAPQQVKDYIIQTAKDNAGFIDQRRGVVTIAEQNAAAAKMEIDAAKYSYLKPGTALNGTQITALNNAMVAKGNEVAQLQEIIRQESALGRVSKENQLRLILAANEHQGLQRAFSGARAESGRTQRALQEVANGLNVGKINSAYDRAAEILGSKERVSGLVDTLQRIWTDPKLDGIARERATYQFIQNLDSPNVFDRLNSYWMNSVLSGPATHVVNVTGQTALALAEAASKTLAAGVEAVSTVGGLRRPREVFFSEALAGAFGGLMGLPRGFRMAGEMVRHGVTPEAMTKFTETGRLGAREVNHALLNIPFRLLGAEDQVFYAIGSSRGLYEKAANIAAREKQSITSGAFGRRVSDLLNKPTEEMLAHADAVGNRARLRGELGDSMFDQLTGLALKGRELDVKGFQPLRYVMPFISTPAQLMKIGAEYSPLGLARAITAKGGARSEIIARSALGSVGMAMLAREYANGNVTGAAPSDPAQRDAFYAAGKVPYAIKLGDQWVSFARLEPVATPLKWTAAMMDTAAANPGQPLDVVSAKMAFALSKSFKDSTYLQGFSSLADAIDDPNSAGRFVSGIVGGLVPRVVSSVAQANDPYVREPEGIIEQIESTLPFLNQNVPTKVTNYGQPVERTEGKQGIAGVVSPADFNTAVQLDPITQRLQQYSLPESFDANGRPVPARALLVGRVGDDIAAYRLNSDEGRNYQQYAGQATYNMLGKLFEDSIPYDGKKFSVLSPADQVRAIRKTIDDARIVGRAQVADEIMNSAKTDQDRQRAADMRISTISKRQDRATYLETLRAMGNLTGPVSSYLDSHRDRDEPSVPEYLRAAPLVREYLALPPYRIGNAEEWDRVRAIRAAAHAYALNTPHPPEMSEADLYTRVDPQAAILLRRYSSDLVQNPARQKILRINPWLEKFLSN